MLEKVMEFFDIKLVKLNIVIILFGLSTAVVANPSGEKTVSTVGTIGPATATINLTMFTKTAIIANTSVRGEIKGVTLAKLSHNKDDYASGVSWMRVQYEIKDDLNGNYKLRNIRVKKTNTSSATHTLSGGGNTFIVEIDEYLADDTNRPAEVEITGDLTYTSDKNNVGMGLVTVSSRVESLGHRVIVPQVSQQIEVIYAITLRTQPLNFGNVIPMTGKYEKKSSIDITGAQGTDVTISINGKNGQEIKDKLINNGKNEIPIVYRVENAVGNLIGELTLGANGDGNAVLKGIIDSNDIPRTQIGGSYTGSVTVEVDYK